MKSFCLALFVLGSLSLVSEVQAGPLGRLAGAVSRVQPLRRVGRAAYQAQPVRRLSGAFGGCANGACR